MYEIVNDFGNKSNNNKTLNYKIARDQLKFNQNILYFLIENL